MSRFSNSIGVFNRSLVTPPEMHIKNESEVLFLICNNTNPMTNGKDRQHGIISTYFNGRQRLMSSSIFFYCALIFLNHRFDVIFVGYQSKSFIL